MDEGLIQAQVMAARIACLRMTAEQLKTLHRSVEHASGLPARSQWDRTAAAACRGPRREEIAKAAGIGVGYYTRMEQGR
jgi:hypothetical protein